MNPRPNFEEWLKEQDYDTLLWEYKKVLEEIRQREQQQLNDCSINSDDDEEIREHKSNLALQMIGNLKMY